MKAFTRIIYVFSLLLSVILATACSNDHDTTEEVPAVDILSRFNAEGEAYLTVQIPLGSAAMSRATTFDDGVNGEWKVKDVYILMFAGTSESDATFASAYKVETPSLSLSALQQVTATVTITIHDANLNTGNKLFPFVVVNNNSSAITTTTFPATSVTFANGGSSVTLTGGSSTFADLANVTIANYVDGDGYFLMTNATLADGNTTSATLFHLPEMSPNYFFPTEAESRGNPAAHICVERLAAKTTVEDGITYSAGEASILGNNYAKFASTDLSFALDNYNTKSYAYRHLSAMSYLRFVENTPVTPHAPLAYRTYWGEDINYNSGSGLSYTTHAAYLALTDEQKTAFWHAMGGDVYCAENTFDVENMQDNYTTSVLVRLQLNGGGNFYTTSITGSDIVFQPPHTEISEEGTSAEASFSPVRHSPRQSAAITSRSAVVTYDGTNTATIDDYLRTWLVEQSATLRTWLRNYAGNEPKHLRITISNDAARGLATATLSQTAQTSGTGYTQFEGMKASLQSLLDGLTLYYYQSGYCYYRVLIRHFDDTQTPWNSTAAMEDNTTPWVYGDGTDTYNNDYLGRYGMVRNNWYDITITSITHIGSPIIPPLTTDADDKVEQLLNATLSISGWEAHDQNL